MNKLGSLVLVLVLVFGLTVAWQSSTIADTGQAADAQAPAKSCCKAKAASECPKAAAAEKAAGCEKKCDKAANAAKSGCPFAAAAATQPAAEKTGCCAKAQLAAYTADGAEKKTCPKADKAGCCEKKCDGDKKCCDKCTGKCEGDKKCCDCKCCDKDGKCDKTSCPMNKDGKCTKAEGAKCEKSCPKAAAQAGCAMNSTTRPSDSAEKTGCCAKKASLAAAPAEPKSEGCKSKCSKSKGTVATATQPAAAGQS